MAKGRIISKSITVSQRVAKLSTAWVKLLYTWLIPHVDDFGRFHADPDIIKGTVFPKEKYVTANKLSIWINELNEAGLINLYLHNGDTFLEIIDFEEHQYFRSDRPRKAEYPEPEKHTDSQNATNGIPTTTNGSPILSVSVSVSKSISNKYSEGSDELRLSELLYKKIKERNPEHKEANLQKWAYDIDLMLRIDKRKPDIIEKLIIWCQQDSFWQNNILSTSKLRAQYDQLFLKMKADKEKLISITQKIEADRKYKLGLQKEKEWQAEKEEERKPPPPEVLNKINQILKPINYERIKQ
jgi:hypothetical protein